MTEIKLEAGSYGVHDTLRKGFSHALDGVVSNHPLEVSEKNHVVNIVKQDIKSARATQGIHMAMKLTTERSIVSKVHRMAGLPSSNLSLRILTGANDFVGPEDIFNEISENMIDYTI